MIWPGAGAASAERTFDEARIDLLMQRAQAVLFTFPDSAFVYASTSLVESERVNYTLGIGVSHQLMGEVFYHQGVYTESLNHLLQAQNIFKARMDAGRLANNLNYQGLVYYNTKQPGLALTLHEQALKLYEENRDTRGIAYSLGCLGRLYEKRGEYDLALDYQHKAQIHYEQIDEPHGLATILENIGSIYEDQEKFDVARDYFLRSLTLNEKTGDSLSMIVNINNLGDIYRKTSRFREAEVMTRRALEVAGRMKDRYQLSSAYKDLSKVYALEKNYDKAYEHLEIGRNLYEGMLAKDATKQLALLQTLFELERKNNEIGKLENAQRLNRFTRGAMGGGLLLLTLLGAVIISRQRLKIKRNREIIAQNQKVYAAERKVMDMELQNTQLHERALQQQLDANAKSLTAHTLHLMGKNKVLEDIRHKLSDLQQADAPEQKKRIKYLVKMIDHTAVQDKDWEDFRTIFEQVHQDFFVKLKACSPDLTAADFRLAALIRLNMASKDMAALLGISQDSLRIARYRLRKKLPIAEGQNLSHFIISC